MVRVPSESRPGYFHFLEPEKGRCSCKGYSVHGHCKHLAPYKPIATAMVNAHEKGQIGRHAMYATAEGYRFVTEHMGRRVHEVRRSVCGAYTEEHASSYWGWLVGDSVAGAQVLGRAA